MGSSDTVKARVELFSVLSNAKDFFYSIETKVVGRHCGVVIVPPVFESWPISRSFFCLYVFRYRNIP